MHHTQGNFSHIEDIDALWFNILITFNTQIDIYRHQVLMYDSMMCTILVIITIPTSHDNILITGTFNFIKSHMTYLEH